MHARVHFGLWPSIPIIPDVRTTGSIFVGSPGPCTEIKHGFACLGLTRVLSRTLRPVSCKAVPCGLCNPVVLGAVGFGNRSIWVLPTSRSRVGLRAHAFAAVWPLHSKPSDEFRHFVFRRLLPAPIPFLLMEEQGACPQTCQRHRQPVQGAIKPFLTSRMGVGSAEPACQPMTTLRAEGTRGGAQHTIE